MKTRTIYIAFDDKTFDNAEACKAHEAEHIEGRLVGLTIEQVRAALAREDTELSDAIEDIGLRINKARREAGDLKRGRKAAGSIESNQVPDKADTSECDVGSEPEKPVSGLEERDPKIEEALRRARSAGRSAWDARKGAIVPDAFAGVKPLHDAWLEGWAEGQASRSPMTLGEAAE